MKNINEIKEKINSLKFELKEKEDRNIVIDEEVEDLNEKEDKIMLISLPLSIATIALIVTIINLSAIELGGIAIALLCGLCGGSLIANTIKSLIIETKKANLSKEKVSNFDIIDEKEEQLELVESLLKNAQLENSKELNQKSIDNIDYNNKLVNSTINSRNKARTLELTKRNTRRYN